MGCNAGDQPDVARPQTLRLAVGRDRVSPGVAAAQAMVAITPQVVTSRRLNGPSRLTSRAPHAPRPAGFSDVITMDATLHERRAQPRRAADFSTQTFRVKRFAIWTITDNLPGQMRGARFHRDRQQTER
jgi:hypothetical protein